MTSLWRHWWVHVSIFEKSPPAIFEAFCIGINNQKSFCFYSEKSNVYAYAPAYTRNDICTILIDLTLDFNFNRNTTADSKLINH